MQLLPYAILDMDGTLLDSSGMWDDVARDLLAQWNAVYTPRQGDDTMTMTIDGAAAYFVEQCHLPVTPQQLAQQIRDRARDAYGTTATLKPGVREALDLMRAKGVTLCVASGTEKPLVDAALEKFGVLDRFAFTLSCETPQGKAEPEVYLRAAEKLGGDPGQIMVFEDSPVAVQTARAAGFYTIGVLDEHTRPHWQEVRSNADTTLENWTDWCAEQQA